MDLDFDDYEEQGVKQEQKVTPVKVKQEQKVKQGPTDTPVKQKAKQKKKVKQQQEQEPTDTPVKVKQEQKTKDEEVTRLWEQHSKEWTAALPMVQNSWRFEAKQMAYAKRAFIDASWLQMVDVEGEARLICTPCSDAGKECVINPKMCNLKRHHTSSRHEAKTKAFLGVEVGPTGTRCTLTQIPTNPSQASGRQQPAARSRQLAASKRSKSSMTSN